MKRRYVVILGLILFILQTTVFQFLKFQGVTPNIPLIVTVIIVLLYGNPSGIIFAVCSGVLQDSMMSKVLSINIILYASIAIVIGLMEEKIFKDNFITPIILIAASTIFYNVMFFVFMYLIKSPIHYSGLIMRVSIEMVENIIIGMLVYKWAFKKVVGYSLR